jgi:pyruvate dehydrogenase E2 component (dihydrolipoamide acetyltransferase)
MPSLGADMEAGTLVEWLKHPGDVIKRGDIIAIVDTQKGAIEIEVFEDGLIEHVIVQPGQQVPVGTVLARIRGEREPVVSVVPETRAPLPTPAAVVARAPAVAIAAQPPGPARPEPRRRLRVSPIARKVAADLSVDLAQVHGTGPQGAITRGDVERAAAALKAAAPAAVAAVPPPAPAPAARAAAMRTAIAAAMARAKREIPHYYLSTTIDMHAALEWLRAENERRPMPERLLAIVLLIKAVGLALRVVPELNGHWVDGAFRPGAGMHVGCAISLRGGGLVAPAIHDVDRKDLGTLMREMRDLVNRARAGSLKSSELSDPTITVTNLGEQGVEATFGIIYPPQVALVGFGTVRERPWAVHGRVEPRRLMTATLSADHRASDGHRGGLLLAAIDRLLQTPEQL